MGNNTKTALLCAYTLASAKRYGEAEALLLSDAELAKTTEALDLLARVYAEQGDVAEARRIWQNIQMHHPEHRPSALALKNLDRPPRAPLGERAVWCAAALAFALGCCVAWGIFALRSEPPPPPARTAEVSWPGIPTGRDLKALAAYRGQVTRLCLSADFFADPARAAQRRVLTDALAATLGLAPSAVFLAEAAPGTPEGAIRLELTLR